MLPRHAQLGQIYHLYIPGRYNSDIVFSSPGHFVYKILCTCGVYLIIICPIYTPPCFWNDVPGKPTIVNNNNSCFIDVIAVCILTTVEHGIGLPWLHPVTGATHVCQKVTPEGPGTLQYSVTYGMRGATEKSRNHIS